jgi:hypothetical protein
LRCSAAAGDWAAYGASKWVELTGQKSYWIDLVQTNTTNARKLTKLGGTVTAVETGPVWDPTGTVVAFSGDDANTIYQANVLTGDVSLALLPGTRAHIQACLRCALLLTDRRAVEGAR